MRTALLACLAALMVSGCGLDGPPSQQAKETAKPAGSPATPAPSPASANVEKNAARSQGPLSAPAGGSSASPSSAHPTVPEEPLNKVVAGTNEPAPHSARGERGDPRVIVEQTENTAAGIGWNKDIVLSRPGTVGFHVTSQGRFAVTIVTDKAYQALQRSDEKALAKQDVLYMRESEGYEMNGKVALPAGTWWFIIENRSEAAVDFHLKCFSLSE